MRSREQLNLALDLLRRGDFAAGWSLYESRMNLPDWVAWAVRDSMVRHRDRLLRPGDTLASRDIVIFTEQGLGDNIMFARYLPMLAAQGARVTLACEPALRPIFERVAGINTVLSPPPDHPDGKLNLSALRFDSFAPLLSLPYVFATSYETIPAEVPYLRPNPTRVAYWRERFAARGRAGRKRVGVVFQANPSARGWMPRSMSIADLTPLTRIDSVDLVNLQHGPSGRELASTFPDVIDALPEPVELDEFAARVAATDLLISVDTMAAHCAGAMGHPVWVALPAASDWRWGREDTICRWYPSAQLFRQTSDRGWAEVVAQIAERFHAV